MKLDDALRERISLLLNCDVGEIQNDTTFEALELDSLMVLELVALVEQRVGHELPEEDLPGLLSIAHVEQYVEALEQQ